MPKIEARRVSEIYDAFVNGDSYSNAEAIVLCGSFKKAADALSPLGKRFEVSFKEAIKNYISLSEICAARGIGNGKSS